MASRLGSKIEVRNVSSDDGSNPAVGSGKNFKDWFKVLVCCDVGGSTPSWDITPLYRPDSLSKYYEGQTVTVTSDSAFELNVYGCIDVNFRCDNSSGGTPTLIVYALPYIEQGE